MELTTRCPQCDTVFSAALEQLQLRKGYIRCVHCAYIFDGFEAVVPAAPQPAASARAASPITPMPPSRFPESASIGQKPVDGPSTADDGGKPLRTDPPVAGGAFIIPPADKVAFDSKSPTRPFSIGEVGGAPSDAQTGSSEPLMPSVLRQRGDTRGTPSFTISDASRPGSAAPRSEPALGARPGPSALDADSSQVSHSAPQSPDETDDFLYIEPQAGRRSDREQTAGFDGSQAPRRWMTPVWGVLILLGLVILLMQGVYVYRAQLANNFPALRASLEHACVQIGCSVPYERHIEAIAITGSALRSSAAPQDGVSALTLEVTLRNAHERPQEWPTLVLDLKDASGAVVVRRNLPPQVWVPADQLSGPFPAGRELTVQLPLAVRDLQANGYQLDKFFP